MRTSAKHERSKRINQLNMMIIIAGAGNVGTHLA